YCGYGRIRASIDARAICLLVWTGRYCGDSAAAATHPQSDRTYADHHHGLRTPAGVSRAWNFAAIARRGTRSNAQARQIKRFDIVTAPIVLPRPLRTALEAAAQALFDLGGQSSADSLRPVGQAALVRPV